MKMFTGSILDERLRRLNIHQSCIIMFEAKTLSSISAGRILSMDEPLMKPKKTSNMTKLISK